MRSPGRDGPSLRYGDAAGGRRGRRASRSRADQRQIIGRVIFRVKLKTKGGGAVSESLRLEIAFLGQEDGAVGQIETLAVPLVDPVGEAAIADAMAMLGRVDRVITDLDPPLRMRPNAMAKMAGKHLRAKADT